MPEQFWLCNTCRHPYSDKDHATECEAIHRHPESIVSCRWSPPDNGFYQNETRTGIYPSQVTLRFIVNSHCRVATYTLTGVRNG